jgi:hypothetical protein
VISFAVGISVIKVYIVGHIVTLGGTGRLMVRHNKRLTKKAIQPSSRPAIQT